jgi:hypothetical protein
MGAFKVNSRIHLIAFSTNPGLVPRVDGFLIETNQ